MKIHLIGAGGIGVSALARYFLSQGWEVSGSDKSPSPLLQELKAEGIKIKIGEQKKNLNPEADLVVYTQATLSDNPELQEARKLRIRTLSYPKVLGELTKEFTAIALAGTHGKSTTTALTALALLESKMDPTIIVGAKIPQLDGKNFRLGKSKYLVVEADEYKDAFLNYYPRAALITNLDREHLDYFKDLNHVKRSFRKFINNLDNNGILVLNKDNAPLLSLGKQLKRKVIWYSLKEKVLAQKIKKHLKIYGEHNLSNALGVYKLARALGIEEKDILKAFSRYEGAWRRMELRGLYKIRETKYRIPVYDDYAHHPTEIKATLSAFREKFPKMRIVCVFQPHQTDRLKKLFKEFTSAFDEANDLILLDVFRVKGREKHKAGTREEVNSERLVKTIQKRGSGSETVLYL
ncbi:MAG: UDP-N-acetylmuramate--L-alanine ligase, partial [bacterium]|nr:UDP-N-acetylmuramate--L-alanine ligase [bacterium]